jgi:hypothetical protein
VTTDNERGQSERVQALLDQAEEHPEVAQALAVFRAASTRAPFVPAPAPVASYSASANS